MIVDLLFCATLAALVDDQPQDRDTSSSNEIVVTGERWPRTLRETSSSVVVLSESGLEASGSDRFDQILSAVPNIQQGSGEEGPAIRGQDSTGVLRNVFAFLGGSRPRVTLQVDGRAVSYYEYVSGSAPIWDVARVEIFRSPQTTTQGRNSIAGALFIETRDPTFSWEGKARAIVGSFRTRQVSTMISGPIVDGQLAFRVSGDLRLSRMASEMADGIADADIDRDDYGVARIKMLATPSALPGLRIETTYVHTRSQAPQFEAVAAPFRQRRFPTPERTNGVIRVEVDSLTARLDARLGDALTSQLTLSVGDASMRRFGLPGLGLARSRIRDRSAEAVLRWEPGGAVQLIGGLHAVVTRQRQSIDITGLGIGKGSLLDHQNSVGLFAEAQWRPVPKLTIVSGLRWQSDRQDRAGAVGPVPGGLKVDYDERFSAWLPKLSLAYAFSPSATAGLLFQHAYNPGGVSVSLVRRVEDRFAEERLRNVEAFFRGSFARAKGSLTINVFHNDIRDSQRQLLVPVAVPGGGTLFATEFANAPKARTKGLEVEFGWNGDNGLSARIGLGLLRTRIQRTVLPTDRSLGKDFQRSPRVSAMAAIDWRPSPSWRLSANLRHHDRYFSDDSNDPLRRVGAATVVDLRGAWTRGPVTLFGYARNAFNRFELTYLFTPTFGTASDPRELGIGLEGRF